MGQELEDRTGGRWTRGLASDGQPEQCALLSFLVSVTITSSN